MKTKGGGATELPAGRGNFNNRFNVNSYNYNNRASRGIDCLSILRIFSGMKTYQKLYQKLCSFDNLQIAYQKAKKGKLSPPSVAEFAEHWQYHLWKLHHELCNKTYQPQPLKIFILRDPKTRRICVSQFRDRIVHHALVNILQPIFEPRFIYDSHASRRGKGTFLALKRAAIFIRKVTRNGRLVKEAKNNNQVKGYALKCDIKRYFDNVDHKLLIGIISKRIKDQEVLWLITAILNNYNSGVSGKGMPLGNWTSQFFANIYLHELDHFVKHELKAKYYLRYVDDFVVFHQSKTALREYEPKIKEFLSSLRVELHSDKCKIIPLSSGINLLGFRIFYHHKLIRKRNLRTFRRKMILLFEDYGSEKVSVQQVFDIFNGWKGYALLGNSYTICQKQEEWITKELGRRTFPNPHKLL